MSNLLRCANGHEWEAPAEDAGLAGDATIPCPVCGSVPKTLSPPTLPLSLPPPPVGMMAGSGQAPAQAPPNLKGYEILGELGRGGMGIVYRAVQRERNRVVALKVIRRERLAHPEMLTRFRREAQAAARLAHPNIVLVHEAGQDRGVHHLAREHG